MLAYMQLSKLLYKDRRNPIKFQGSVPLEKIELGLATMTRLEARFWAEENNTQRKIVFTEHEPSHVCEETSQDQEKSGPQTQGTRKKAAHKSEGPGKERPTNLSSQKMNVP